MINIPVQFTQVIQNPGSNGGYPNQIRASDLDRNFIYSALDVDSSLVELTPGTGGYQSRKLKIPSVPQSGTYVLGSVNGVLQWLQTEIC